MIRWLLLATLALPALVSPQAIQPVGGITMVYSSAGCATTILSDNFDDNDVTDWTAGTGTVTASGGAAHAAFAADGQNFYYKDITAISEAWEKITLTYTAVEPFVVGDGQYINGFLKPDTADTNVVYFYIDMPVATALWGINYRTDAGQAIARSTVEVLEATYTLKFHWKKATTSSANNGVIQLWVDGTLYVDLSNVDNNRQADRALLGNFYSHKGGNLTIDNLLVCADDPDA